MLSSFGYTWSTMLHDTTGFGRLDTSAAYRPARQLFGDGGIESSTLWNYKIIGRYTLPFELGLSGSWKVQSGQQYGRTISVAFPGDGTQTVRVEPITAHRYPSVAIMDVRADKSFTFGKRGKLTGQFDVFNLTNSGVPTTVRLTSVNFNEVTAILSPRVIRVGFRYDF